MPQTRYSEEAPTALPLTPMLKQAEAGAGTNGHTAPPTAPVDDRPRLKLRRAIHSGEADGDQPGRISTLVFDEPTGGTVMTIGVPMRLRQNEDGSVIQENDSAALGRYIASMCKVPLSSVKSMHPLDFIEACGMVMDFFRDTTPSP